MLPLVLLHGFTGAPETWDPVVSRLGTRPTFAPALLGHDGTPGPTAIESFEDEVDRVADLVREQGLEGSHLVGYSMGGRVALGLLIRHPSLFRRATLIGASPGLSDPDERQTRAAWDEEWARLLETEGLHSFVAAWEALPLFATQEALAPRVVERQRRIRLSHDARGLARSLRSIGLARMPDYRPRLEGIAIPVDVVAGEHDPKFRALAGELAGALPRGRKEVVAGAGHNVVLERPDEIAALLRRDIE